MDAEKPMVTGFVCGRFQHIHRGHMRIIDAALEVCDKLLILVGSAQESGTERNPFTYAYRADLIQRVYSNYGWRVVVRPLPDMTTEDDIRPEWGRYVLEHVRNVLPNGPHLMAYGNDENREGWFDPVDIAGISTIVVPRHELPISATEMRGYLLNNEPWKWLEWAPMALRPRFADIQAELRRQLGVHHENTTR